MLRGGRCRLTVIVCEQLALLPQLSVAVHVGCTLRRTGRSASVSTGVTTGAASQSSLTVGPSNSGVAGHSTVSSAAQSISARSCRLTVIVCEQLEPVAAVVRRRPGRAVYFLAHGSLRSSVSTGVTTGAASQSSLTVGLSNSGAAGHSTVLSARSRCFGAVVS